MARLTDGSPLFALRERRHSYMTPKPLGIQILLLGHRVTKISPSSKASPACLGGGNVAPPTNL